MAKRKKKTKKTKSFKGFFICLFVIVLIGVLGYFSYVSYNKAKEISKKIENYVNEIDIKEVTTENISLIKVNEEDFNFVWKSNSEYITDSGVVKRPQYFDGDEIVTLTLEVKIDNSNPIDEFVYGLLKLNDLTFTYKVKVLKEEPTPNEVIEFIEAGIIVPAYTTANISLPTISDLFKEANIVWTSSNSNVITNTGIIGEAGNCTLSAAINYKEQEKKIDYNISVGDSLPILTEVMINFDDFANASTFKEITKNDVTFKNTRIITTSTEEDEIGEVTLKIARVRTSQDSTAMIVFNKKYEKLKSFSFQYEIYETDKSNKKSLNTIIRMEYSFDNSTWNTFKELTNVTINKNTFEVDLSSLNDFYFRVLFINETMEVRLDIDNLIVKRCINTTDIIESLKSRISDNLSNSVMLPNTTIYGGEVKYTSSNEAVLNEFGTINKQEASTIVKLNVSIEGFDNPINTAFDINVAGLADVVPVEVFFIDLGKYGASDCGESIYIKLGSIDVLVDAGDNREDSNKAIQEVIDANSEDKIIEYVIATHPDADHIGGMPFIFDVYKIINLIQFNGDHTTNLYDNYVTKYENEGCSECTVLDSYNNVGGCKRVIELGNDVKINFLNTLNYEGKETNTRSVVFVLEAYGIRTLLTGDADNGSNPNLEADYMATVGDIDILKAVHHATKEGTSSAFLEAVKPEVVIITNGNYFGNKHGHPSPQAINRIYSYNNETDIYAVVGGDSENCAETASNSYKCEVEDRFVDRNGTIKVTISSNNYKITSEYFNDNPLELSSTNFWKSNEMKTAQHK